MAQESEVQLNQNQYQFKTGQTFFYERDMGVYGIDINEFVQMYIQGSGAAPGIFSWWGITGSNIGAIVPMANKLGSLEACSLGSLEKLSTLHCRMQSGAIWSLKFGKTPGFHCGQQSKKNLMTFSSLAKKLIKLEYFPTKLSIVSLF